VEAGDVKTDREAALATVQWTALLSMVCAAIIGLLGVLDAPWRLLEAASVLVCAVALLRLRSRAAAIVLLAYAVTAAVLALLSWRGVIADLGASMLIGVVVLYPAAQAVGATFKLHRGQRDVDVAGRGSGGSTKAPAGARSTVTVRRMRSWRQGPLVLSYAVLLDGEEIGNISRGGVLTAQVAPGAHSVSVLADGTSAAPLEFEARPDCDLALACGYGLMPTADVAAGVAESAFWHLLGGTGTVNVGGPWTRQVAEPPGDDTHEGEAAAPPQLSV